MLKLKRNLMKLKWGVAGLGRFSEMTMIPTLINMRRTRLLSVYSGDIKRAKSIADKYAIQNHYGNYDDFLNSGIDAVYIGSINSNHYEQAVLAAKAGKHLLIDKPMAITSDQAKEIIEVAKENKVQAAVNYVYRFHPLTIKVKEIIDSMLLGKIISISGQFCINLPPGDNFRYNREESGGGAIRDLGTHIIDLFRYLIGEISSIDGVIDNVVYKTEVEDYAAGMIKFDKGSYGYFNVAYSVPRAFNRIEIVGSKGSLSIDNLIAGRFLSSAKMTILLDGEAKKAFRKRGNKQLRLLKSVSKSFLHNTTPEVTGYDGYINLKLMEEFEQKCYSVKS